MIIWDTNTVYYISKVSKCEKCDIDKIISYAKSESTGISSISAYEIMCRYRCKANYVRRIFSCLRCNGIRILNHPLLPVSGLTLSDLCKIKQSELNFILEDAIIRKANFESAFAFSMLFSVFASALWFSLQEPECDYIIPKMLEVWRSLKEDECRTILRQVFEYSYRTNDCERYVKNAFENLLFDYLHIFQPVAVEIANNVEKKNIDEILNSNELIVSSKGMKNKVLRFGNTSQYVKKLANCYKSNLGSKKYESFMDKLHATYSRVFVKSFGIVQDSCFKYFVDISKRIIESGGLYKKNDILDGLILQHLYIDASDRIISFDGSMNRHLNQYASSIITYKNSINIINLCSKQD